MYQPIRLFVLCLAFVVGCATDDSYQRREHWRQKPLKTGTYQIQENGQTIGYAHQYAWETKAGKDHEYFLIADNNGKLVGHMAADGATEKYMPDGSSQMLGNFTLESASARIFETEYPVRVYQVQMQDVPETKQAPAPVKSGKETAKTTTTATQQDQGKTEHAGPEQDTPKEESTTSSTDNSSEEEGMSKE